MAIRSVVLRGYGNSTFDGTIALVVVRGYAAAAVVVVQKPIPDLPGGRKQDIPRLIMDKDKLLADRLRKDDDDIISIIAFAIEMEIL